MLLLVDASQQIAKKLQLATRKISEGFWRPLVESPGLAGDHPSNRCQLHEPGTTVCRIN